MEIRFFFRFEFDLLKAELNLQTSVNRIYFRTIYSQNGSTYVTLRNDINMMTKQWPTLNSSHSVCEQFQDKINARVERSR